MPVTTWRCEFTALAEASADCRPVTRGGHETSFMIPLSTLSARLIKLTTDRYCPSPDDSQSVRQLYHSVIAE